MQFGRRRRSGRCALLVLVLGCVARAEDTFVDARVATYAQLFSQSVQVGRPGAISSTALAYPFTLSAFVRFGNVDLPGAEDSVSGEFAAWGSLGPRDGRSVDADVTSAWVQYRHGAVRLKLGRQVTLPGAARFVRFDGATVAVTAGPAELEAYGGWVALPRWNLSRGATLLGSVQDGLQDPLLLEAQNRVGQFTAGARASVTLPRQSRLSLGFHEQHDQEGVAFRVLSAEGRVQPLSWLNLGARASLDLQRLAVPEARVWADLRWVVPLSIDYAYQQPSLLLPQTSILAAFGGAAYHEAGAETSIRIIPELRIVARGAGQFYEAQGPGGRGGVSVRWRPGIDGHWLLMAEANRVLAPKNGYTQLRLAGQWRPLPQLAATLDGTTYFYDAAINDVTTSLAGTASVEWRALPQLRVLASTSVFRTPWASVEAQAMLRLVYELDPVSAGASL